MIKPIFIKNRSPEAHFSKRVKLKPVNVQQRIVRKFDYSLKKLEVESNNLESNLNLISKDTYACKTKEQSLILIKKLQKIFSEARLKRKEFDMLFEFGNKCFDNFRPNVNGARHANVFDARLHEVYKSLEFVENQSASTISGLKYNFK